MDPVLLAEEIDTPPQSVLARWSLPSRHALGCNVAALFAQSDRLLERSAVAQIHAAACSSTVELLIERSARLCKPGSKA